MTTKHQVIDCYRAYPDWTSNRIADWCGCRPEYVRATLARAKLKLARRHGEHGKAAEARLAEAFAPHQSGGLPA